jgi:DNA-binding MarR family transcriptional regulator
LFEKAINMSGKPEECARELLDVVPLVMRDIRTQMRRRRTPDLTVPQFRTILFVSRNTGASLSQVADHIGLARPSTSKLVDDLIRGGLMTRQEESSDRRRVSLAVTPRGATLLEASRKGTLAYLAEKLEEISGAERNTILKAMKALRCVFPN